MSLSEFLLLNKNKNHHCVKSARIRSYSGPHFPAFGLNTKRYSVPPRIQSEYGKMRTRITQNTDTFYAVHNNDYKSLRNTNLVIIPNSGDSF